MAISMLQARTSRAAHTSDEAEETTDRETIAVVPLAIPLLSGPGAISTVIVYAYKAKGPLAYLITSAGIVLIGLSIYLSLLAAPFITKKLGKTGINIVTRIMGLILAAIAVEFITTGIKNIFPDLT
jgi:multiple antibiotic resistance protein